MSFTKDEAKGKIAGLIDKFRRDLDSGKAKHFNEEQTKKDYIEPLFEYLNWDIRNSEEVTVEDRVSKGRVDYGFHYDGIPKFYVEAKSLKEDINNIDYMTQAVNYAYLKSTTWAVLTNFEGLKVFNAEWDSKNPRDKIYIDLKWNEILDKFDRVWLLSKDSFLNSELDKEAEEFGKKIKKTLVTPVMKQIFNDLMDWREKLRKSITNYSVNVKVYKNEEGLDEVIQRIIDRLIFIRVCEDRQIEERILQQTLREWLNSHKEDLIVRLNKVFRDFDNGYNSKLFAPHPCEELKIDNIVLIDIIKNLYKSSDGVFDYDFSAIDADILGNIYEEYLGYILRKGKNSKNNAHRKEMGIYYTPTFVVDYIIKNTLGEMLKNMKSDKADKIKILDMACGSGSFLLKAFDTLNNYHKSKNELDFLRKIKILTENIHGVDLDPKAVEIAQLNLLLKTLEKRRLLPKLQNNLKVGNSLIEDSTERAFKWENEFSGILENGGFDVIIGNPPYVRQEELSSEMKKSLEKYEIFNASADLYTYFFERGLKLLKEGGLFSFIVSSKFTKTIYGKRLREFILNNSRIRQIIDFGDLPVFKDATTYPCIIVLEKSLDKSKNNENEILVSKVSSLSNNLEETVKLTSFMLIQETLTESPWSLESTKSNSLVEKIKKSGIPLTEFVGDKLYRGITTSCNDAFIIDETTKNNLLEKDPKCKKIIKNFLTGKDIKKYSTNSKNRYLIFAHTGIDIDSYPAVKEHLSKFKKTLDKIWEVKNGKHPWYELRGCSYYDKFESTKIIYPRINIEPNFTLDNEKFLIQDSAFLIPSSSKFLLGVLNSKLIKFYAKSVCSLLRGGYYDYRYQYVELFPIAKPTKIQESEIEKLVDKILALNQNLRGMHKNSDTGVKIQSQIKEVEKEIDRKVYDLYHLTSKEIEILNSS